MRRFLLAFVIALAAVTFSVGIVFAEGVPGCCY